MGPPCSSCFCFVFWGASGQEQRPARGPPRLGAALGMGLEHALGVHACVLPATGASARVTAPEQRRSAIAAVAFSPEGWQTARRTHTERFLDQFSRVPLLRFYPKFDIFGIVSNDSGSMFILFGAFCVDSTIFQTKIPPWGRFGGQHKIKKLDNTTMTARALHLNVL